MKVRQNSTGGRRGAVLPMVALCLIPFVAMLALAFDMGLLTMARSQAQNAADSAALAGVRKLNGNYASSNNGNYSQVQPAANTVLGANRIIGHAITDINAATSQPYGSSSLQIGYYRYDTTQQAFVADLSNTTSTPTTNPSTGLPYSWSLVKSTVTFKAPLSFARVLWGTNNVSITTTAAAAHRPRDIAVVVDFSGSMGFDSCLGSPWSGQRNRTNNPDLAYPRFGGYSYAVSKQDGQSQDLYDMYQGVNPNVTGGNSWETGNITVNPANVNSSFLDANPIVADYSQGSLGSLSPAFPAASFPAVSSDAYSPGALVVPTTAGNKSANQFQDIPGGDNYLRTNMNSNTSTAYARTIGEVTGTGATTTRTSLSTSTSDADFEVFGYSLPDGSNVPAAGFPAGSANLSDQVNPNTSGGTNNTVDKFAGYSQGPRYWGKTFFLWPADPRHPVTATDRLVASGSTYAANGSPGQLNQWLADLDRNWLLLQNGAAANKSAAGMTRYAAGSYDALLTHWPLYPGNTVNASAWTRTQVINFLQGKDPVSGTTIASTIGGSDVGYTIPSGTYTQNTTVSGSGPSSSPANFWSGPVINPVTGSAAGASLLLDFANLTTAAKTTMKVAGASTTFPNYAAPSPNLGAAFATATALPAGAGAALGNQAVIDAQIGRLILGLYDNANANYDWRSRYLTSATANAPWPDDTKIYSNQTNQGATGQYMQIPGGSTYSINYNAILQWLKTTGPNPFPTSMQCGRVVYYSAIPNSITLPNPASDDEFFWKEYIDFVMGFRTISGTVYDAHTYIGYGRDFDFNGSAINSLPTAQTVNDAYKSGSTTTSITGYPRLALYQDYRDNPMRPKVRYWFGPMSMMDFIINENLGNPTGGSRTGTFANGGCNQSQAISCKLGVRAALLDSQVNHPNDLATLIYFSGTDMNSSNPTRFRHARSPLDLSYQNKIDALFFPLPTIYAPGTTIGWNTGAMNEVPRADGGTCYDLPLMLAYNQFSTYSGLLNANGSGYPTGDAGGLGRQGAQKIVIFETDGVPNTKCDIPTLQGSGAYQQWYPVRLSDSINVTGGGNAWNANNFQTIATQLAAQTTAGGFSQTNKPLLIHTIGFGYLFEPSAPAATQTNALNALNLLQTNGNVNDATAGLTLFPGSNIAAFKIITGNSASRISKMQQAFTQILQKQTVQVSLIQ